MTEANDDGLKSMTLDREDMLDALASALELDIDVAYRPGVLAFLGVASRMAQIVFSAPMESESVEMAAAFRPGLEGEA